MRKSIHGMTMTALLAAALCGAPQARAQDSDSAFDPDGNWRWSLYLWAMSLEGDLGIGPVSADIDLDFGDLLDALDIGGAVVGRYDWGANMVYADIQYYSLKPDAVPGPLGGSVSTEVKMPLVDLMYGHKFRVNDGYVAPLVGLRYMEMDTTLNLDPGPGDLVAARRSASPDFTDVVLGTMIVEPLSSQWDLVWQINYGFGGSDGTWATSLLFQYVTDNDNRWSFGGRIMGVDFEDGLPSGELFAMDTTMTGLTVGFTWD